MAMPVQEIIGEEVILEGECEACIDYAIQKEVIIEDGTIILENGDQCQIVEEVDSSGLFPHCGEKLRGSSFLQRFNNWLSK